MIFAAVADDDTGATDLAGMLADQGLRTVLLIDTPPKAEFDGWTRGYDAVIIGAGTRALTPAESYHRTREAVRLLKAREPRVIAVKYCSTFDSTKDGNIGPAIDAAMDELDERFTVALPALPVNGRTTYMGHHFVGTQLLSDSPMRHHPLTPMTEANLVRHLQSQTRRRVGLARYPAWEALAGVDGDIAVLDCISDADLGDVCRSIADLRLISGSSAFAMKLPAIWRERGWWSPSKFEMSRPDKSGSGVLIVAGSCSVATEKQNAWAERNGADVLTLDPVQLAEDRVGDEPRPSCVLRLMKTASAPEDRQRVAEWAQAKGFTTNEAGLAVAYGLARYVRKYVEQQLPSALIVAGGETAGAVCRVLELGALEVGRNIEPGVPLCVSLGRFRLPVVLKSGNFGSEDFYARAAAAAGEIMV
jgi:3-dehydrotetronate 4-kinase